MIKLLKITSLHQNPKFSSSSSSSKPQLCSYKNRATRFFSITNMAQKSKSSKINYINKKNPYSDRGLDKFSALLTDLGEKRDKILSKTDPKHIVLVRFAYKNSNECVPVVVKQKDRPAADSEPVRRPSQADRKSLVRVRNLRRLNKPSYYVAAIVVLILFLLSVFGRSATILCTCVFWYLVPVLKQSSSKSTVTFTKPNEFSRILQPVGPSGFCSPIRAHRKTW